MTGRDLMMGGPLDGERMDIAPARPGQDDTTMLHESGAIYVRVSAMDEFHGGLACWQYDRHATPEEIGKAQFGGPRAGQPVSFGQTSINHNGAPVITNRDGITLGDLRHLLALAAKMEDGARVSGILKINGRARQLRIDP